MTIIQALNFIPFIKIQNNLFSLRRYKYISVIVTSLNRKWEG